MGAGRPSYKPLIIAALPGTSNEIIERTGLARTTVWRVTTAMYDAEEIHIGKMEYKFGQRIATYALGPGEDAECPEREETPAQAARRERAHAKRLAAAADLLDDDKLWDTSAARADALAWADRHRTTRDPMIEALFGPAKRPAATLETV